MAIMKDGAEMTHYVTRSKRYTKTADGKRHYGWSVRHIREEYDADHSVVAFGLNVTESSLRRIEGLLYARD